MISEEEGRNSRPFTDNWGKASYGKAYLVHSKGGARKSYKKEKKKNYEKGKRDSEKGSSI